MRSVDKCIARLERRPPPGISDHDRGDGRHGILNGGTFHASATLKEDDGMPVIGGRLITFAIGTGAARQTCTATTRSRALPRHRETRRNVAPRSVPHRGEHEAANFGSQLHGHHRYQSSDKAGFVDHRNARAVGHRADRSAYTTRRQRLGRRTRTRVLDESAALISKGWGSRRGVSLVYVTHQYRSR